MCYATVPMNNNSLFKCAMPPSLWTITHCTCDMLLSIWTITHCPRVLCILFTYWCHIKTENIISIEIWWYCWYWAHICNTKLHKVITLSTLMAIMLNAYHLLLILSIERQHLSTSEVKQPLQWLIQHYYNYLCMYSWMYMYIQISTIIKCIMWKKNIKIYAL